MLTSLCRHGSLYVVYSSHMQFGLTALIHAATNGRIDSVKYLIEKTTAQVNTTDNVSNG